MSTNSDWEKDKFSWWLQVKAALSGETPEDYCRRNYGTVREPRGTPHKKSPGPLTKEGYERSKKYRR